MKGRFDWCPNNPDGVHSFFWNYVRSLRPMCNACGYIDTTRKAE